MNDNTPDLAAPDKPPTNPKPRRRLGWLKWAITAFALLVVTYYAGVFGYYWREVAELHDGRKIIVTRYQTYGGRHEIGQGPPISLQRLTFTVPETGERVTWESGTTPDIGRVNLLALAVHILDGVPYVISEPHLCLAYNKWDRPDPPYVILKHENRQWKRIPIEQLPAEFKTINLVINTKSHHETITNFIRNWTVQPELIRKLNSSLRQLEYQSIQRGPVGRGCDKMFGNGKGRWLGEGFFTTNFGFHACVATCRKYEFDEQHCPCNQFFSEE